MWQCSQFIGNVFNAMLVKCQNMNGLSLNYDTKSIATPTIKSLKMPFFSLYLLLKCVSFLFTASKEPFASPIIAAHVLYIMLIACEELVFCWDISHISLIFKTFNSFEDLFMSTVYNVYAIRDLTLIQWEKCVKY